MWCACKIGPRHWEENYVGVDWAQRRLVAFASQEEGVSALAAGEVTAGREVCPLTGLQVEVGGGALQDECVAVTGGDYAQVLVLAPAGSELVCVLGVEAAAEAAWLRWLANCIAMCNYLGACEQSDLEPDHDLVGALKELLPEEGVIEVGPPAFHFDSNQSAAAFAHLINAHTAALAINGLPMPLAQARIVFNALEPAVALRALRLRRCSLEPQTVALLCKVLLTSSAVVEELDLSDNALRDDGAMALAETLAALPNLSTLKLSHSEIGARGGRALGMALRRVVRLRTLDLDRNAIGDAGMAAVARSLGALAYLETLRLHGCLAGAAHALESMIRGLIDNTNVSVAGGLHLLDLQDNLFQSAAIRRFLSQCSGLGCPQIIRLGRKRKTHLTMAMNDAEGGGVEGAAAVRRTLPQVVDLGFEPASGRASSPEAAASPESSSAAPGPTGPARLEVVFGGEISPFRLLAAVTNLLGLFHGQARIHAGQVGRKDNMQLVVIEIDSHDGREHDHARRLADLFARGDKTLHLLHVVAVRVLPAATQLENGDRDDDGSPTELDEPPRRISVYFNSYRQPAPPDSALAAREAADPAPLDGKRPELEQDLLQTVRAALLVDDVASTLDDLHAQVRTIARSVAVLDLFVPSQRSEIGRYSLEAKLARAEAREGGLEPRKSRISPLLAAAIARIARCTPADLLVVRGFFAAMHGDVEKCVAAAEQGKYSLGMMLSLSQVTSFESATLQAAVVAQDADLFSLVMSQDLNEDDLAATGIRLASIVHNDLFARSVVVQQQARALAESEQPEAVDAGTAGLVHELLAFPRLNSKWEPRQLRLQFVNHPRHYAITRPAGPESNAAARGTTTTAAAAAAEDDAGVRYFQTMDESRLEVLHAKASRQLSTLLLQAMGDAPRPQEDLDGNNAAFEALGIAYANRRTGLVDELLCQLVCQVTCNPALRSIEAGWRLIVLSLRILAPSRALCESLFRVFENRMASQLTPNRMVRWAQEALQRFLESTPAQRKARAVFAADPSVRFDVVRQVLSGEECFEVHVHCANGTGTRVRVSPFTSFEELLQRIHAHGGSHLRRLPAAARGNGHENYGYDVNDGDLDDADDDEREARLSAQAQAHEQRWRDFVFTFQERAKQPRRVLAWETDAYWWRWERAVAQVLGREDDSGDLGEDGDNGLQQSGPTSPIGLQLESPEPEDAAQLNLETFVSAPTLWYFGPGVDALRCELVYWQRQQSLLRGELCSSNPEAFAFLCCLSACIRISGGCGQFLQLSSSDQVRVCMGHVPTALRRQVGKGADSPWRQRFARIVGEFVAAVSRAGDGPTGAGELPDTTTLQRAYLAYMDSWPLAGGVSFSGVVPLHLSVAGQERSLLYFDDGRQQRARLVLSSKGLFLLVLTRDAHSSRAVALMWWTPLDEIVRLQILDTSTMLVATRRDEIEFTCDDPARLYKSVVAQCTANLSVGNPKIPREVRMVEFVHAFPALPWPPPPPPLYDMEGNPVDVWAAGQAEDGNLALDLPTTASVLAEML